MKKKLFLLSIVFLFAVCLALSSCNGSGSGSSTTTAPAVTTAPVTTAPVTTAPVTTLPTASYTFADVDTVYDGTAKTIAVTGLPEGSTVLYSVNGGEAVGAVAVTDAGTYTVVANVTLPAGYAPLAPLTATLTVAKADYQLPAGVVYFENSEIAYNGQWHMPQPANALPEGVSYSAVGAPVMTAGSVGSYTITFGFSDPALAANYNAPAALSGITLTVVKGEIDLSGVSLDDVNIPYDGAYHAHPGLTGDLPSILRVDIFGGGKNKGEYTVTASFSFVDEADAANYNLPADMTATLTIGAGAYDLSGFNFSDRTVAYSGRNQYPDFAMADGLTFTVVVTKDGEVVSEVKLPGVYDVAVSFEVADENEYLTPEPVSFRITVEKGTHGALDVPTWQPVGGWDATVGDQSFFYLEGGETGHAVELQVPAVLLDTELGTLVITYTHTLNGEATEDLSAAGLYRTTATLAYTSDYYNLPAGYATEYTYEWRVADKTVDASGITFEDASATYTGSEIGIEATYDSAVYTYITGITYVVDGEAIAVGTYTVTAYVNTDPESGYAPFALTATLTINTAAIDLSGVEFVWNYTDPFTMDGNAHTVTLSADTVAALQALGVTIAGYTGNTATAEGEYTAVVNLTCDSNYTLTLTSASCDWAIALSDDDAWSDVVNP